MTASKHRELAVWWENVRGRVEGKPPNDQIDRALVMVSRMVLLAAISAMVAVGAAAYSVMEVIR
jgi:hypothetical protein